MQTLPSDPTHGTSSTTDLADVRPEILELRGAERVESPSSRARNALLIGLLTGLVSLGLGGRLLTSEAQAPLAAASSSVPTGAELVPVPVTLTAPREDEVIRGNVVPVRGQAAATVADVWVVGRVGRLVLGEARVRAQDGVIAVDLPVLTLPDAPVTAIELAIETREAGRLMTLATRRVVVAPRAPVAIASLREDIGAGSPRLELGGTAPAGWTVEVSIRPSGDETVDVAATSCGATFDDAVLPFGLEHWVCLVPIAEGSSGLAIDLRWASPAGMAGSILLPRVESCRPGSIPAALDGVIGAGSAQPGLAAASGGSSCSTAARSDGATPSGRRGPRSGP